MDQFDSEKPREGLWDAIEKELPGSSSEKMVPIKRMWQLAMGMTAVFVISIFAWQLGNDNSEGLTTNITDPSQISSVDQLENYYSVKVNSRIQELRKYEVDDELLSEVEFLKEEFEL